LEIWLTRQARRQTIGSGQKYNFVQKITSGTTEKNSMSQNYQDSNPYQSDEFLAGRDSALLAIPAERLGFIRRTYLHLALAVAAFVGLEAILLAAIPADALQNFFGRIQGMGWLLVLGAFMVVSWVARWWAESGQSKTMQYLGLSLYVVAEAVLFLPLLFVATRYFGSSVLPSAALITGIAFAGLTAVVFFTGADLHWMGRALAVAGLGALAAVVCSMIFGFSLGILFSAGMVVLAAGYIAYDTSNVLHHYRTDQHVAASLALFASVALLFWYVLRLMMAFGQQD
jgi:FtsH-binding integral membrane protein